MKSRKRVRDWNTNGDELKAYDTWVVATELAFAGNWVDTQIDPLSVNCLSAMPTGTGSSERIGRKIVIKSIQVSGSIFNAGLIEGYNPIRPGSVLIAIVLDTQTNGAQLQGGDVYYTGESDIYFGNLLVACTPFRRLEGMSRFKVLKKVLLRFIAAPFATVLEDDQGVGLINMPQQNVTFQVNLDLNIPVTFFSDDEGIESVMDNSLHIIANRDNTESSGGQVLLSYISRIRYVG